MTLAELSVWGVKEGKEYPCIMEAKHTNNETDFFICEIQRTTNAIFPQLLVNMSVTHQSRRCYGVIRYSFHWINGKLCYQI